MKFAKFMSIAIVATAAFIAVASAKQTRAPGENQEAMFNLDQIGQSATFSRRKEGCYTLRIYSKERKLQVLALSQEYRKLAEQYSQVTNKMQEKADQTKVLQIELRAIESQQVKLTEEAGGVPIWEPRFYNIIGLGSDFISLQRDSQTIVIPKASIEVIYIEHEAD